MTVIVMREPLVECDECPVSKLCWVLNEGKEDERTAEHEELEKPDYYCPLISIVSAPYGGNTQ